MGGKIKFVKRGGAIAATIPSTDLAAHEDGSGPPEPLEINRVQDLELPKEINILYINPNADYQQGVQISTRQAVSSVGTRTISLPIVLDDSKAKQVADVLHYNAWVERTSYKLSLSRKWSKIEPTDVLEVQYRGSSIFMRVLSKDESVAGKINLECVAEDITIYTQSGAGASPSNVPPQTIKIPVQTILVFLDIPILRDTDDDAGVYVAASGVRDGWNGCTIFKSSDEGSTYTIVFSITNEATIGNTTTVLGNYAGGFTFDELNSVTVVLYTGSLSSVTEDLVLSGSNYAVIGNEVIQFKNAELIDTNTYRLTGLLRGCKGTEWAINTHAIGERFVLADVTTWRRLELPSADIGISKLYKAPTVGTTVQTAAATEFTNTAVGLECLSPVEVGAGRNASGDLVINWKRRGRISAEWRDYADVPLGELSESYVIEFVDSTFTTIKRSVTISAATTYTYTVGDQAADYPEGIDSIYMRICQVSQVVGNGFFTNYTFTQKIYPSSTRWRLYVTEYSTSFQGSLVSELGLRAAVSGLDQCTGGTASISNGSNASFAFDNNLSTYAQWSVAVPQWLEYQFASPVVVREMLLRAIQGSRGCKSFSLQVYLGTSWTSVFSITNQSWADGEAKLYTI